MGALSCPHEDDINEAAGSASYPPTPTSPSICTSHRPVEDRKGAKASNGMGWAIGKTVATMASASYKVHAGPAAL